MYQISPKFETGMKSIQTFYCEIKVSNILTTFSGGSMLEPEGQGK